MDQKSHGAPVHATGVAAFSTYSRDSIWMGVGGCTFSGPDRLPEATEEEDDIAKACQRIWKVKVPLKVRISSWFMLKQRLVTRAYRRKWQQDVLTECIMCNRITEDVPHFFFNCAFARRVWESQQITGLDIFSDERLWNSVGRYRGWGTLVLVRAWVVLWVIWLHCNECIFKGREASLDGVLHEVDCLLAIWAVGR